MFKILLYTSYVQTSSIFDYSILLKLYIHFAVTEDGQVLIPKPGSKIKPIQVMRMSKVSAIF